MEEIMDWFEENYPDYYKQVVFKLTPEMKADPSLIQVAITTKQRETFVMTS
jgi:type I site-specific restriction endonuclease